MIGMALTACIGCLLTDPSDNRADAVGSDSWTIFVPGTIALDLFSDDPAWGTKYTVRVNGGGRSYTDRGEEGRTQTGERRVVHRQGRGGAYTDRGEEGESKDRCIESKDRCTCMLAGRTLSSNFPPALTGATPA